ncbi:MAG TPA: aminopeptidase [Lachnoclostridium phytofermentans]|uniref:Aminopeptidase n=1 Tax=Lachnoclostridium phytofermentans TaxID=66219 RepID=A0A3D2X4M0_9FIRM|nr:aminopeptidase [Lachnoclostridium sp.]HCL01854.1 aminopeptidase [Lachnoclostridium phytofermentans]
MKFEIFLMLLLVVSVLTSLFVEGIKKLLDERGKTYYSNMLAGITSIVLSVFVGFAYVILVQVALNIQMAVYLIALILLSWLCSMVGYDKVLQAITQIRGGKKIE